MTFAKDIANSVWNTQSSSFTNTFRGTPKTSKALEGLKSFLKALMRPMREAPSGPYKPPYGPYKAIKGPISFLRAS